MIEAWTLCILSIVLCGTVLFAQPASDALKFDELTVEANLSYTETQRIVPERIKRFVLETKRQPRRLKYLVHYRARVRQSGDFYDRADQWAAGARSAIALSRTSYDASDVLILDGGVRQNETLEFWFVTRGELPRVKPEFERSEAIDCPSVFAYQTDRSFDKAQPVVLKAEARSDGERIFNWTVSDGEIIGRNGGPELEINVSGSSKNRLTAFVEVEGLPAPCENRAIVVASFGKIPRLVDSFGVIPNGDFRARTDAFMADLAKHPTTQGYAYIYGNRTGGGRDSAARKRLLANHIYFRNFEATRIKIVEVGFRETASCDYWLVPAGADAPQPTPTVRPQFVLRKPARRSKPN